MPTPLSTGCRAPGKPRPTFGPRLLGIALLFAFAVAPAAEPDTGLRVTVSEARFHFLQADGTELPVSKIIGAILSVQTDDGSIRKLRIDRAEPDPRDASGEVMLYEFSVQDPATQQWQPYCEPDPDQRRTGFPLAGNQVGGATRPGGFFVTCTGGAYGKCIRFGYRPWRGVNGPILYQTCVRMVRADYCGNDVGHTRNGTPINIFDPFGIQKRDDVPGMKFEAGWGPRGAVCVNKTRLQQVTTLEQLAAECPRLKEEGALTECDETKALRGGALILNESY